MIVSICGFVLIVFGLLALALQRFYSSVPARELKRLAARGDHLAAALYRPVAYGTTMRLLLWMAAWLSFSFGFLLTIPNMPGLLAFALLTIVLGTMVFLQSVRLTVHSARLAVHAAPALNWLLGYVHAPFDVLAHRVSRYRQHTAHSGLYEKEDLVLLLQQQKEQVDNRISHHDLQLIERAAHFDDRHAADIVLPMSKAKLVSVSDHIGPVLLGELHESGYNSFLVYEDSRDHITGTLFLREAMQAKEGGRVADLMHPRVCYVHEDFTLRQVLQAFTRTSQFLVVVINSFEEPVGIITLQHLLAQLVGEHAEDDFDAFEDRAAVANYQPELPEPQEVLTSDEEVAAESLEPVPVVVESDDGSSQPNE